MVFNAYINLQLFYFLYFNQYFINQFVLIKYMKLYYKLKRNISYK